MSDVRRLSRLGLAAVTALSVMAALSPTVAAGGSGSTRWVDDDGHAGPRNCSGSASAKKTVQKAVDASNQNDTILVCPGTYRGYVVVGPDKDGLTIRGTDPWKATLMPPLGEMSTAGEKPVMVTVDEATDVTIRGLRISMKNEPNCTDVDTAIFVLGARRHAIRGNQIFASARLPRLRLHHRHVRDQQGGAHRGPGHDPGNGCPHRAQPGHEFRVLRHRGQWQCRRRGADHGQLASLLPHCRARHGHLDGLRARHARRLPE